MVQTEDVKSFLKGEKSWAQVEQVTPGQMLRWLEAGLERFESEDLEGAERIFVALTTLEPRDADVHAFLGATRVAREDFEGARSSFDTAIALNGAHVLSLCHRGELHLMSGEREEGIADLKHARKLDPLGRTQPGRRAGRMLAALSK